MGELVNWDVIQRRLSWCFGEGKIAAEALFDGCYIIRSEVTKDMMPAAEMVASYKRLELVGRAFRNIRTVQLEVRSVYHKTDERIRRRVRKKAKPSRPRTIETEVEGSGTANTTCSSLPTNPKVSTSNPVVF